MATVFSIKDPNPGVWFKFDEDDPDSGEIRIRAMNSERVKALNKECNKEKVEYKRGGRYVYDVPNEEKSSKMTWDYIIVEWNGLEDETGAPIACTTENKIDLMNKNVGFSQFVSRCLELLSEKEEERVARIEKNLSTELKGSKKNRVAKGAES